MLRTKVRIGEFEVIGFERMLILELNITIMVLGGEFSVRYLRLELWQGLDEVDVKLC